tara:strand:- start:260 stop:439 length:180 start_codon:yes stop_codon:yes gene_type:complete
MPPLNLLNKMAFKATHRVIETQEPVMVINDDPFDWDALEVINQKEITRWYKTCHLEEVA